MAMPLKQHSGMDFFNSDTENLQRKASERISPTNAENNQFCANQIRVPNSGASKSFSGSGFSTPVIDEESEFDCEEFAPASTVNLDAPLQEDPEEQRVKKRGSNHILEETVSSRLRRQTIANTGDYSSRRNVAPSSTSSKSSQRNTRRLSMDGRNGDSSSVTSRGSVTGPRSRQSSLFKETQSSLQRARRSTMDHMSRSMDSVALRRSRSTRTELPSREKQTSDVQAWGRAKSRLESKCRDAENKLKRYEDEVTRLRNEASVLKKSNAEMKRELGELRPYRRKAQTLEKELKSVRQGYESKFQSLTRELENAKRLAAQTSNRVNFPRDQVENGFQRGSRYAPRLSPGVTNDEASESFRNASDALAFDGPPSGIGRAQQQRMGRMPMQRRVTVAPGEASRLLKQMSCHVKIRGLKRGFNCQSLTKLLQGYGEVLHTRVTKDIFTDVLIGYGTFASPSSARKAVEGLKRRDFNATTTSSPPADAQDV